MMPFQIAYDYLMGNKNPYVDVGKMFTGQKQMENTQQSLSAQIDYEQYLRAGNQRAYDDWMHYVGSQGKTIRYPELSYPGQIYRANTSIARAGFDYNTATANYVGNYPYRVAGLYGISSKLSRFM